MTNFLLIAHTSTSNCSVTLKIIVQRQNIQWISQGNFLGRPQSKWLTKKAVLWAILGVYSHSVVVKWQSGHVIKKIYAVHIFLMIWILALQIFIQSFYTPLIKIGTFSEKLWWQRACWDVHIINLHFLALLPVICAQCSRTCWHQLCKNLPVQQQEEGEKRAGWVYH